MIIFDTINNTWTQHNLIFKFTDQKDKHPYLLKNFAAATHIQSGLFFYCGGGPSNEAVLLQLSDYNQIDSNVEIQVKIMSKMQQKRCWHFSVYSRPYVYVIGGFDGSKRLNTCEKMEIKPIFDDNLSIQQQLQQQQQTQQQFQPFDSMKEERCMFSACLCENIQRIYVCGGIVGKNGQFSDSIEYYSIIDNKWQYLQVKLPKKVCGASSSYYSEQNRIIIFGGSYGSQRMSRKIIEFDIEQEKFEAVGKMKCKRQMNNKAFQIGKKVYLLGGNFQYNYEIIDIDDMCSDFNEKDYVYSNIAKNDLNNYAGVNIIQ